MTKLSNQLHSYAYRQPAECVHPLLAIMDNGRCKHCGKRVTEAEPGIYPRATPADVYATWRKLWGDRTPEQIAAYHRLAADCRDSGYPMSEMYDRTQLTDAEIAEMENRT